MELSLARRQVLGASRSERLQPDFAVLDKEEPESVAAFLLDAAEGTDRPVHLQQQEAEHTVPRGQVVAASDDLLREGVAFTHQGQVALRVSDSRPQLLV